MSLKETIILWNSGVESALAGNFDQAISEWLSMPEPGAKIYYNIACMHLKQGQLDKAIKNLDVAVKKDPHLALAFFQRGCLLLQKKKYDAALSDFDETLRKLRSNPFIDYKQLGLQYKLYACEVQYNQGFVLMKQGRNVEAMDELMKAKSKAANFTESRHKMIAPALENMRAGKVGFQPYELPDRALLFQPPRNKTEVLKPVTFLASARVLSSVKDNDSYVGFVGVQDRETKGGSSKSPTPSPSTSPLPKSRANQPPERPPKVDRPDKPDIPPPPAAEVIKITRRNSSLHGEDSRPRNRSKPPSDEFKKINIKGGHGGGGGGSSSLARPPKPEIAPPPFHPEGNARKSAPPPERRPKVPQAKQSKPTESLPLPTKRQPPRTPSPNTAVESKMTVKVHYSTTRALRLNSSAKFNELDQAICKKFGCPAGSLTFYSKKGDGELLEVNDDASMKELTSNLEDGFRLTLWAYDKHESSPESEDVALKTVVARFAYTAQFDDELAFSAGDFIEVTVDINDDWYEGRVNGNTGIFPKSYVKDA